MRRRGKALKRPYGAYHSARDGHSDEELCRVGHRRSASARATRWCFAASRSPARRAAWPILRRSRTEAGSESDGIATGP